MKSLLIVGVLLLGVSLGTADQTNLDESAKEASKVGQGSVWDRTRLVEDLFKNYDKRVNPDNVTLKFGISLISYDLVESENKLNSYVWLKELWNDNRLSWDTKKYGVGILRIDADDVWKPDMTMYNSATTEMVKCWKSNVLIYSTGNVLWVPPCKQSTYCKLTVDRHPYGEQVCSLKYGSWTYDGLTMDVALYKDEKKIDTSDLLGNTSPYKIVSTTGEKVVKYYDCCTEPYPNLTFNMTLQRLSPVELLNRQDNKKIMDNEVDA